MEEGGGFRVSANPSTIGQLLCTHGVCVGVVCSVMWCGVYSVVCGVICVVCGV